MNRIARSARGASAYTAVALSFTPALEDITRQARGAAAYSQANFGSREAGSSICDSWQSSDSTDSSQGGKQTWAVVFGKLKSLHGLEDDWDGQGAAAPNPAVVDSAISLLDHLRQHKVSPPDFAIAGVNGTVLFEWHDNGVYTEMEVLTPTEAQVRIVASSNPAPVVVNLIRRT